MTVSLGGNSLSSEGICLFVDLWEAQPCLGDLGINKRPDPHGSDEFFVVHIRNSCEKSGEMFSPLTAGKNTVCTTGEITAQHRRAGPGALCTARTVSRDSEEWPARPLCRQPNYNTLSALLIN